MGISIKMKISIAAAISLLLIGRSGSFAFAPSSSRTRISNQECCQSPVKASNPRYSGPSSCYNNKQSTEVLLFSSAADDSSQSSSLTQDDDDELPSTSSDDIIISQAENIAVNKIFNSVDVDGSGAIDMDEFHGHLSSVGYSSDEIKKSFEEMDTDKNGEISREEFRDAVLTGATLAATDNGTSTSDGATTSTTTTTTTISDQEEKEIIITELSPKGYFLNSVRQTYQPLSPLGRVSQKVELMGPFKKVHQKISSLFGIDTKKISKLGVSFALSYSFISNLNGAISFSIAWYMTVKRTGLSPLAPGQWKSLLASYGMIYGLVQLLRPFRVAMAIAMSKLSAEYLEMTQSKLNCSRGVAVGCQYMMGQVMMACCCLCGVSFVTLLTGVPLR